MSLSHYYVLYIKLVATAFQLDQPTSLLGMSSSIPDIGEPSSLAKVVNPLKVAPISQVDATLYYL
jgi:hypothetical protein